MHSFKPIPCRLLSLGADMRRREFLGALGGAVAAWPVVAHAQQSAKLWRVGYLSGVSRQAGSGVYAGFVRGMRELGYVEGSDFVIEWRSAEGRYERFRSLAAELVDLKVDVLFTLATVAIRPLQQATTTIPIVMAYSTDPVGNGFVASLTHPGSNTTGLASSSDDTSPKQLEFLSLIRPRLNRVGVLGNPNSPTYLPVRKGVEAAALKAGLSVIHVEARNPVDIDNAFAALTASGAQGVVAAGDPVFFNERDRLAELALRAHLPSMFSQREYVAAGGLMSYGENLSNFAYRAASFVDRIFKGAKPADLPIEQPTRFHLVVNGKTANALGLTIPPQLNMFADEVIE